MVDINAERGLLIGALFFTAIAIAIAGATWNQLSTVQVSDADITEYIQENKDWINSQIDHPTNLFDKAYVDAGDGLVLEEMKILENDMAKAITDIRLEIKRIESSSDVTTQPTNNTPTRIADFDIEVATYLGEVKSYYERGDFVAFTGDSGENRKQDMTVRVTDPSGQLVKDKDTATYSDGDFSEIYEVKSDDPRGVYRVEIIIGFERDIVQFEVR